MATFNGERYLKYQLNSIIQQIGHGDEIIICDDGSRDGTIRIIQEYSQKDNRIKLTRNTHRGVVLNFEDAIRKCKNDLILLSDQDDVWNANKVSVVKSAFQRGNKMLVLHNALNYCDGRPQELLIQKMKHGVLKNIIKSNYWGCCMAFRREFVKDILPFPNRLIAHDQWIGLIAESRNEVQFIDESLIMHRVHEKNVTRKLTLAKKVSFRINILTRFIKYQLKICRAAR